MPQSEYYLLLLVLAQFSTFVRRKKEKIPNSLKEKQNTKILISTCGGDVKMNIDLISGLDLKYESVVSQSKKVFFDVIKQGK